MNTLKDRRLTKMFDLRLRRGRRLLECLWRQAQQVSSAVRRNYVPSNPSSFSRRDEGGESGLFLRHRLESFDLEQLPPRDWRERLRPFDRILVVICKEAEDDDCRIDFMEKWVPRIGLNPNPREVKVRVSRHELQDSRISPLWRFTQSSILLSNCVSRNSCLASVNPPASTWMIRCGLALP